MTDIAAESALAWMLADAARPLLDIRARSLVCAQIGADQHQVAIEGLLAILSKRPVALPVETEKHLARWLSSYAGSDSEERLRHLAEQLRRSPRSPDSDGTDQAPAQARNADPKLDE